MIVRVTSSGSCGSDPHRYEPFGPFLDEGDILAHEPVGVVEEVGSGVTELAAGDRVVVLPLLTDDDPLRTESFATHHLPLAVAPNAYAIFQSKRDGVIKVLLRPSCRRAP